ncbi:hypothetical protein NEHOM01_1604, partial [Nematocida homosporus]|uniref:uncharacterized protein n=1 Tax=Nematocida homosporus TaxID=1912981 RepID=UPI00221FC4FE
MATTCMSLSPDELFQIQKRLSDPFLVVLSAATLERVLRTADQLGGHYPQHGLDKVIGSIDARLVRQTLQIKERPTTTRSLTIQPTAITLLDHQLSLPLGLLALATSIRQGTTITETQIKTILDLDTSSRLVALALVSLFEAIIQTAQDPNSLCYNALLNLLAHPSSEPKLNALWTIQALPKPAALLTTTLATLKEDSNQRLPNPILTPGLLALTALLLYRMPHLTNLPSDLDLIIQRTLTKSSNENVLNGLLIIFWVLTQKGLTTHLPYLAILVIFSRSIPIKRSARGILTEHLGRHPSPQALTIMDALAAPHPPTRKLLSFFQVPLSLLANYAHLPISEGHPKRIKLGIALWSATQSTTWELNWSDPFNRIASIRIALLPPTERPSSLHHLPTTIMAQLSPTLFNQTSIHHLELLRLAIKLIRQQGLSSPNAPPILLLALKKNLFVRSTIKTLLHHHHDTKELLPLLRRFISAPACRLALSLLTHQPIPTLPPTQTNITHPKVTPLPSLFALTIHHLLPPQPLKQALFAALKLYTTHSLLGDIGSYFRLDALILLSLRYIHRRQFFTRLTQHCPTLLQDPPYSLILAKLTPRTLKLTPTEQHQLTHYLFLFAQDKSRRIALFLFNVLLPTLKLSTTLKLSPTITPLNPTSYPLPPTNQLNS